MTLYEWLCQRLPKNWANFLIGSWYLTLLLIMAFLWMMRVRDQHNIYLDV